MPVFPLLDKYAQVIDEYRGVLVVTVHAQQIATVGISFKILSDDI